MSIDALAQDLAEELETSLKLLESYRRDGDAPVPAEALPSLLAQCRNICNGIEQTPPLRSLHHFACSGGTLIAKCLSALPNTTMVSEIDPLSTMGIDGTGSKRGFAPTDIILGLRNAARPVGEDVLAEVFRRSVSVAHELLSQQGLNLVLRDHAHSHFCARTDPESRPTLYEILQLTAPLRSVVTIRHPLDSFLSLSHNGWLHFDPPTLGEYSRRYAAFLDRHAELPVVLYEDFIRSPEEVLERLCGLLELPFSPLALDLFPVVKMTGDSGRSSSQIKERARRDVPPGIAEMRESSQDYRALCDRLGYAL